MVNGDVIKDKIAANYDNFLLEQYELFKEVKESVSEKIQTYENNYKAYYLNNLDKDNKIAYEIALEEIAQMKTALNEMTELLEIFGAFTEETMAVDLDVLEFLKSQNARLKELKNEMKNKGNASGPLKDNFSSEYKSTFLTVFLKFLFLLIIFIIVYIQIKNK